MKILCATLSLLLTLSVGAFAPTVTLNLKRQASRNGLKGAVPVLTAVTITPAATTTTTTTSLNALTPTGPFCPFRSTASEAMAPNMERLNSMGPDFATAMNRVQLDVQMGNTPDKDLLIRVSADMEAGVEQWESLTMRLRLSTDFQTREYGKLTQAHLASYDTSVEGLASMMKWQAGCMRSLADNTPPPMPPPDLDLEKMMNQDPSTASPSMTSMQAAEAITASPFSASSFESDTVREEYETLVQDHSALIQFGTKYGDFDPLGKLAYLDQVDIVQERWDAFYFRFKLMGALNEDYKKQCDKFLSSMNMDEDGYRELLKKCHDMMREDAEKERDGTNL